jgi:predicted enzyme related to lactoylglutathione lyase
MSEVSSYPNGQPCWADVTVPDVDAGAAFYSELFGWEAEKDPRPEAGGYTMFSRGGKHVAAASPPQEDGIPPHWTVYLASDDVDATTGRIREAGGTVLAEPFDVFDSGRMTVAADPSGAVFGVWQARDHIGSQLRGEPGTLNWAEVQTRDRAAAQPFYEQVFGYGATVQDMARGGEYVVFEVDGSPVAGLLEIGRDWGEVPSNWSVVFQVADCDVAVATVEKHGGQLLHGPAEIEGVGRFAVVADPWGAVFQVIT